MDIILPEIVAAGIYNSQIAVKDRAITKNRKATMFEIEIPIEEGGISYIASEERHISPDIVICAKPGQIRHTKLPFKCYYIHMILNTGTLYDILADIPVFIETKRSAEYRKIFEGLCKHSNSPLEIDRIKAFSLVLELVYLLDKDSKKQLYRNGLKSGNYEIIEDVKQMRSEIGILYLNKFNEKVLNKLISENELEFHKLFLMLS